VAFLAISVLLLGLIAIFASDAKATPQSTTGFSWIASAPGALAPGHDQQARCPVCGRLICAIPDDELVASSLDSALPPTGLGSMLAIGFVHLPRVPASYPPAFVFPASFEPRGPPFVD
jgi:hypothetical protein